MKKIIIFIVVSCAVIAYAGNKQLKDGTLIFWDDTTEVIQYNSYRVEVRLYEPSAQNVFGSVTLEDRVSGKVYRGDNNLFISAGEKRGYVDFSGLKNGYRYSVRVKINNN